MLKKDLFAEVLEKRNDLLITPDFTDLDFCLSNCGHADLADNFVADDEIEAAKSNLNDFLDGFTKEGIAKKMLAEAGNPKGAWWENVTEEELRAREPEGWYEDALADGSLKKVTFGYVFDEL